MTPTVLYLRGVKLQVKIVKTWLCTKEAANKGTQIVQMSDCLSPHKWFCYGHQTFNQTDNNNLGQCIRKLTCRNSCFLTQLFLTLTCFCLLTCFSVPVTGTALISPPLWLQDTSHSPLRSLFQAAAPAVHTSPSGKQQIFRIWLPGEKKDPHCTDSILQLASWLRRGIL